MVTMNKSPVIVLITAGTLTFYPSVGVPSLSCAVNVCAN